MQSEEVEESRALVANDLRVLVAQLNEKIESAARQGLRVEGRTRWRGRPGSP